MRSYHFISILLLFCATHTSFAQKAEPINQLNENKQKQGKWIVKYKNGRTKYQGTFNAGKPYGVMKRYYPKGQLKAVMHFDTITRITRTKLYNPNGQLFAEGNFKDNKRDSVWSYYFEDRKTEKISYKKGMKSGGYIVFHENGELKIKAHFVNDSLSGNYYRYYPSGARKCGFKYINGKRNGLCMTWYENGEVELSGGYINSRRHGDWTYFKRNGTPKYVVKYFKGKITNPEVINKSNQKEFEELEKNKLKLKDPEKFKNNPTGAFKRP
ncbi:toxin-antitoxin system YwqK family antitoxin [Prolixibacteraceae bacterium JC049]|nr:toxin-antitoxin system YwqK family antitoxin [Prolixibacteraceae bacterium JC049]